jgi:hypothetical protein
MLVISGAYIFPHASPHACCPLPHTPHARCWKAARILGVGFQPAPHEGGSPPCREDRGRFLPPARMARPPPVRLGGHAWATGGGLVPMYGGPCSGGDSRLCSQRSPLAAEGQAPARNAPGLARTGHPMGLHASRRLSLAGDVATLAPGKSPRRVGQQHEKIPVRQSANPLPAYLKLQLPIRRSARKQG